MDKSVIQIAVNMEMIFNELSIAPLSANRFDSDAKMEIFAKAVGEARKKGFRNIRSYHNVHDIKLAEDYPLYEWLNNKNVPEIYRSFLYGMIIQPFIKDDDTELEEKYVTSNYYYENVENNFEKRECVGLASAYLYETLSISLPSSFIWEDHLLTISIENTETVNYAQVLNIVANSSFEKDEIINFIETSSNIEIIETTLSPNDKKIHLSAHHGKDELKEFCKKIKLSPYVTEMRSTNWGGKKFIRKTFKDGTIELVLTESEKGYALLVQTTGRNLRETNEIAKKLDEKFS